MNGRTGILAFGADGALVVLVSLRPMKARRVTGSICCRSFSSVQFECCDLIVCFKILRGFTNVIPVSFFVWTSSSIRGHSTKLYYPDSRVTARHFFSVRAVQLWNKLPEELVSASSVSAFYIASKFNARVVLMFCFSAVCFFIDVSFTAVVSAL